MLQHPRSGPLICDTDIPHNIALTSFAVPRVTILGQNRKGTPFVYDRSPRLQLT